MSNLVVCESAVAITTHLRDVADKAISLSGHWPRPRALCGAEIAWDTRIPVSVARCRTCREKAGLTEKDAP